MWYIHMMKYYLAIKSNEVLIYAARMNPATMLSEGSHLQKNHILNNYIYMQFPARQIHRDRK